MSSPEDASSHSGEDEEQEKHSQSTTLNVGNLRRRALLSTLGELRNGQQPGQQQQQQQQSLSLGSGSLSLSLDSQPPGPSGLNLYHLPTATSSTITPSSGGAPSSSSGTLRGGAGASAAGGGSAGGGHCNQQTSPFLVSPSQDILRSQASQEGDGLGFSNLLGDGSGSHMASTSGAAPDRPVPESVEPSEIQDLHRHQMQYQSFVTRMNQGGSQDAAAAAAAGETGAPGSADRGGGVHRGGGTHRSIRVVPRAPGSDSNPSSADELGLAAACRQRREQLEQHGVPSQPSKLVTTAVHAPSAVHTPAVHAPVVHAPASGDQVVHRTTTESDGSSPDKQASKPLSGARVSRVQRVPTGLQSSEKTSSSSVSASSTGQRSSTKPTSFYTEATPAAAMASETDETDDSQSVGQSVESPSDVATTSTAGEGSRTDCAVERVKVAAGQPLSSLESESYQAPFSHSPPSEGVDSSSPLEGRGVTLLKRTDVPSLSSSSAASHTAPLVRRTTSSSDTTETKVSSSGSEGHVDKVVSKKVLRTTPQKQTESAMVDSPELLGAESQQTQDLGHQVPRWCDQLSFESEVSPEPKPSRRLSCQESSSSSSDQTSPPSRVPPAKRRREKSRSASCSSDVPKWQETGESSAQAQPATYSSDRKSADVTPFKRSIRFSDGTGNPTLQSPTSPTPPHSSSLSYGMSSSASGSSSLSPSSSGKSSLTPSSSAKYPSSSGGSSSSAQPQSSDGNSSSQSGRGASGQSSGSSAGDGGGSGTFTRDSQSNSAALDETPYLETQGGPNDETAVVEQSNEQGTLLDDSIFENIEDSDVEVVFSQASKVFKSPDDADTSVPKNSGDPGATAAEYNDETQEYMDVDTQPSDQDTPELIMDYEAVQNAKNAKGSSPVVPLQSPMKALSSQQASNGDTNEDESLVQVGIDCSLRLHFSQSQEFCVDEAKKSQNSDLAAKPDVEEKCEDMEQNINSSEDGAKAEEVKRSEDAGELKLVEELKEQHLPVDEVAPRQEPLYESLRYDEEDSVNLSSKSASGRESSVSSVQKNAQSNGSQVSEVSQLTSSAGTPFQFQLPRGPLLKPVVSITPPPEDVVTPTSTTTTNTNTTQSEEGSKEATPVTVSPSEVDTNFFRRSVTPPLLQEGTHKASQSSQSRKSPQSQKSRSLEPQQMTPPLNPRAKSRRTPTLSSSAKKSPRLLSLSRKKSGAVFIAARRPLALPGDNSTKSGEGFEMGVGSREEQDSMLSCGLSPSPPPINVPSDSQFEASDNSEVPEVIFKITKPPSLNQSRTEEAGERMDEDDEPAAAVSERPPDSQSQARIARELDKVGMEDDMLREVKSDKTRGVVQEPRLASLVESERPLAKSPVTILSVGGGDDEDMEVENVLKTAETAQLEKQRANVAERGRLSISLAASCNVPSSTSTNSSSPVPSVRLQPAGSPVRPLSSPVYNPLHSRTPSGYHHPHSPVAALASSEFVSPSRSISAEGLQELRRQVTERVGKEVEVCELRYVRTVCTVIEERVISSELVQNGVVVPGSGKCWPESSRPYNTQEIKVELVPHESPPTQHHHQLPHHSSSSLLHPSPAIILSPFTSRVSSPMTTYHPHGQFSSPTPASRDLFRIPPTSVPLLSPGSSSHPSPSHMQQSPLSTSHLSTSSLSASHPPSHQHMSSLAVTHRRERSPSVPPLQLSPVPVRFQGQGNGNGNQTETHSSLNGVKNQVEARSSNGARSQVEAHISQVAQGIGRGEVNKREDHRHNHRQISGTDHQGQSTEAPLPITTPPCRETGSSSITPFKAGTRRSLSTRSRSSPKNIWTAKTQSPLTQSAQEGASTSDGIPREGSTLRVGATPSGSTIETDGSMVSGGLGEGLTSGMSATPSSGNLEAGDAVIARWATDKRWYAAVVKNVKGGRVSVHFEDGEKGYVSLSQVFKQGLLQKDESVTAGEFEDDPEVHGCFLGFDEEGKKFILKTSVGEVVNFDIDRFCISHDTALKYTKHSKSSPSARKRLHTPQHQVNPPSAKRRKKAISASPSALQSDDDVRVEDYVSLSQSALFQGYTFFLTQRSKEELYTSSSPEGKVSYDKQKLLNSIIHRNGRVLEVYKGERIIDGRYFVISDGFCRTHKYLLGLALAIPCVSHKWIEECIEEGAVVDFLMYRLPAGVPHTSTSSIEWVPQERGKILLGINAYVHHTQSTFKNKWGCLLKLSGATVLPKIPSVNKYLKSQGVGDECGETVVIAEMSTKKLPRSITDLRDSAGMMVLGTEWIIQCLIQGKVVEFKPFLLPVD